MYRSACVLALVAVVTAGGAARASDPIGGYLLVDKVVLEPVDAPTTIQIWGSIALAKENRGSDYKEPVRGYLYYKVAAGKEDVCRKEWNDLKKAAGTGQIIGFASRYDLKALGTVRKANVKPETPDTYPVANGLVKIGAGDDETTFSFEGTIAALTKLRTLPALKEPGDGDLVPSGEITLVTRNIIDKKHAKAKYVFELEAASGGKEEGTVESGDKETKWTPKMKLKAGEKYTWRVRAVEGEWKGPVATSSFVVKGEK
jgi:hypothetical protein